LCVRMVNMKKATVREVQHNFRKVLRWIEDGEEVVISRRGRAVANLAPIAGETQKIEWPDFSRRLKAIWGIAPAGKPASRIIIDQRNERP
jgi:antitoxin (DNA-binding transcriptional repressor) of toxin-antitoxin stability system